ncbi:OmpA family protein [Halothiobacillus sp. DCM-1]|uniref:OmpA family protein n=1 Tax=Halothiobacillus sp. DCM-1 TaxID=3112558 RepID=UPI00324721EB
MATPPPPIGTAEETAAIEAIQAEMSRVAQQQAQTRPWHEGWEDDSKLIEDDQSFWLITMVDLMTLLLTMFVLLAAYAYQSKSTQEPLPSSSGSTHEAAPVDQTLHTTLGPAPSASPTPGQTPSQGKIPQAGNALIGSADTHPPHTPAEPTANPPAPLAPLPPSDTLSPNARALFSGLGNAVDVSVVKGRINLRVKDNILFTSGDATLSPAGARVIDQLATRLQSGDYPIAVQGHTDDKPIHTAQFPSNWELSAARAAAVVQQLIAQGVAANRLSAVGLADTQPIAPNDTAQGRAENRRVDIELQLPPELLNGAKP